MARIEVYGPGGFDPSKPNNNIVSVEEVPDSPAPPPSTDDKLAEARTVLAAGAAELAALPAPTTPADLTSTVADILTRAAQALNGGA